MSEPGAIRLPASLQHARVSGLPPASFYIPDFISEEEEKLLLNKVHPRAAYPARMASTDTRCY